MELSLQLMMTAMALFQEAEMPLGDTAAFDSPDAGVEGTVNPERDRIVGSIAGAWQDFERTVGAWGTDPSPIYDEMRAAAKRQAEKGVY